METIISLVVVGVVYSVIYVFKSLISKDTEAVGGPVMSEVFPHIEILEAEEAGPSGTPSNDTAGGEKPKEFRKTPSGTAHEHRSTSDSSSAADDKPKGKRFSISDKSEAKRAFIYSEIFGRKCQ